VGVEPRGGIAGAVAAFRAAILMRRGIAADIIGGRGISSRITSTTCRCPSYPRRGMQSWVRRSMRSGGGQLQTGIGCTGVTVGVQGGVPFRPPSI
jgi:hypothetical protein